MQKEYTCIVCPTSCRITVSQQGSKVAIAGNTCERGAVYALHEFTDPRRILTTTIVIENGTKSRLPVISTEEVPRNKLRECIEALYKVKVTAPVKAGDVVMRNICNTGVDVIASRSMEAQNE